MCIYSYACNYLQLLCSSSTKFKSASDDASSHNATRRPEIAIAGETAFDTVPSENSHHRIYHIETWTDSERDRCVVRGRRYLGVGADAIHQMTKR